MVLHIRNLEFNKVTLDFYNFSKAVTKNFHCQKKVTEKIENWQIKLGIPAEIWHKRCLAVHTYKMSTVISSKKQPNMVIIWVSAYDLFWVSNLAKVVHFSL